MWTISGKAELASRDELNMELLCSGARSPSSMKGVRSFSTAGYLSSRLNYAQESVTSHLPHLRAPQHGSGLIERVTGTPSSLLHDAAMRRRDAVGDIWWYRGPRCRYTLTRHLHSCLALRGRLNCRPNLLIIF